LISPTQRSRRTAGFLLAAPILIVCGPFLFTSRDLVAPDFQEYFGPHAEFARKEFLSSGELPRWNPCQYAGVPFVGTGQNNFYYPPSWLFLVLPAARAFGILVALHLLLAAAGTYRLARSYALGREAAVLAGLAYGLSFTLVARASAGHLPNFIALCQAPLLLVLLRRAILRPSARRGLGLAAAGALAIVAASPQMLYQTALLGAALAFVEIQGKGRPVGPAVRVLAGAFVGALALSAVHLLPLFETALASNRRAPAADLIRPYHDFDLSQVVLLSIPRFFWHPASDPWLWHEKAMYLGLLPLMLAGVAIRTRGGPALFYAAAGLLAFLEALSGWLMGWLPWYAGFRMPERDLWILVLALAMLAAFGWQRLRDEPGKNRRRMLAAAAAAAVWSVLLLTVYDARAGVLLFGVLALGSVAAMSQRARWPYVAAVVVALDLGTAALLEFRTGDGAAPPPWYAKAVGADPGESRVLDLTWYKASAVSRGFRLLRGYGHPVPPALSDLYASAWTSSMPSLDTLPATMEPLRDVTVLRDLNVRWIVGGNPPLHPEWKAVAAEGGQVLFEDPKARPMAFLPDVPGSVRFRRDSADRMSLQVKTERVGEVAISESWAPGWRATIDGRPAEMRPFRGALMKVGVPAGESRIVLIYAPLGWRVGRGITGAALLGAALWGLAVLGIRSRRRKA